VVPPGLRQLQPLLQLELWPSSKQLAQRRGPQSLLDLSRSGWGSEQKPDNQQIGDPLERVSGQASGRNCRFPGEQAWRLSASQQLLCTLLEKTQLKLPGPRSTAPGSMPFRGLGSADGSGRKAVTRTYWDQWPEGSKQSPPGSDEKPSELIKEGYCGSYQVCQYKQRGRRWACSGSISLTSAAQSAVSFNHTGG